MSQELFDSALNGDQGALEVYKEQNPSVDWDGFKDGSGHSLVSLAASKGKLHIIDYLVGQGACVNLKNDDGKCALQIAYRDGHPNTARGLIKLYQAANCEIPLSAEELETLQA